MKVDLKIHLRMGRVPFCRAMASSSALGSAEAVIGAHTLSSSPDLWGELQTDMSFQDESEAGACAEEVFADTSCLRSSVRTRREAASNSRDLVCSSRPASWKMMRSDAVPRAGEGDVLQSVSAAVWRSAYHSRCCRA